MLMDEPFGAVDPIVRERLQNEFLRLQEQLAKTILFVTHDIDEAIKMGDLVAVFQAGGVVAQYGPPSEILASPASEFVARFVGTDRGLKRLSLFRVGELDLSPVVTAAVGSDGSAARRAAADGTFAYVLVTDEASRPVGWVHRDRLTTGTCPRTRSSRRRRCSTAGRRSRTRSRCCSTRTCRPGSWSTARAPSGGGSRSTTSRPSCASPMRGRSTRPREPPRTRPPASRRAKQPEDDAETPERSGRPDADDAA